MTRQPSVGYEDLLTGASARQVREALGQRYERGELPAEADIPSERTIGNIARDIQRDGSPTWRIEEADPAEVWPVLDTLLEVMARSEGRVTTLTTVEARLVTNVRAAVPRMDPWRAYAWARGYLAAVNRGSPVWIDLHDLAIDGREARMTETERLIRDAQAKRAKKESH